MVKFTPPIYINPSQQSDEVISFGKDPELQEIDLKNGLSRLGGIWRPPSYTKAYLRAARVLIREALEKNDLDQLGLPIFYLHRHALELFIKELLESMYDIADLRYELYKTDNASEQRPTKKARDRLNSCHNLKSLHEDLTSSSFKLGFPNPPESIGNLVKILEHTESEPTWSRYPKSRKGKDNSHLSNEVVIPSREIHDALERVIYEPEHLTEGEDTFETIIYQEWQFLTTTLDNENYAPLSF